MCNKKIKKKPPSTQNWLDKGLTDVLRSGQATHISSTTTVIFDQVVLFPVQNLALSP